MITNQQLFYIVNKTIKKENDIFFSILDYDKEYYQEEEINSISFDCTFRTIFGSSEGIYLTVYAEGFFDNKYKRICLGTYKTLKESKDAFRTMSKIGAEFSLAVYDFLESYCDDIESSKKLSEKDINNIQSDFSDSYYGL